MKSFLKSKKGFAVVTVVIAVIAVAVSCLFIFSEKGYRTISVIELSGNVIAENNGDRYRAYRNMKLSGGYALTTETESYSYMLLDKDKYVKLEQDSKAVFEDLGTDGNRGTAIRLESGTLTTEIVNALPMGEDYIVRTPNAVLSVRGTYFKVIAKQDSNGEYFTDVYVYGGAVASKRVMPDGTEVDEEVIIESGYKACIKMDEIVTVYVEELIEAEEDKVDPIDVDEIEEDDLVGIYNASVNGHEMFKTSRELWKEIVKRDVDIGKYLSVYNGKAIPIYKEELHGEETMVPDVEVSETTEETTESSVTSISPEIVTAISSAPVMTVSTESAVDGEEAEIISGEETAETTETEEIITTSSATTTTNAETVVSSVNSNENHVVTGTVAPVNTAESGEVVFVTTTTPEETTTTPEETTTTPEETTTTPEETTTTPEETTTTPKETTTTPEETTTTTTTTKVTNTATVYHQPIIVSSVPIVTTPVSSLITSTSETVTSTTESSEIVTSEIVTSEPVTSEGHVCVFETYTSNNDATCTNDGTKTAVCTCGKTDTVTDTGTAKGHTEVEETVAATFAAEGLYRKYCSVCNEELERTVYERLPALYTEDGDITITATGYKQGSALEETAFTGDYVIAQRDSATAVDCSISIEGGTHNVKLDGVNVAATNNIFSVAESASVTLNGVGNNILDKGESGQVAGIWNNGILNIESGNYIFGNDNNTQNMSYAIMNAGEMSILSGDYLIKDNAVYSLYSNTDMLYIKGGNIITPSINGGRGGSVIVTGGSLKNINNAVTGGSISNGFEELDCIVFDTFPTELQRTFINSDGTSYIYALSEDDISDDGKYYIWKPKSMIEVNETNFPDEVFRRDVVGYGADNDNNGYLTTSEIKAVTKLYPNPINYGQEITSLKGIEYFTNLEYLDCSGNLGLKELDISKNIALTYLNCSNTGITSLDVSKNTALEELICQFVNITELDISNNITLRNLNCYETDIAEFDLSKNIALTDINVGHTKITNLDVTANTALSSLTLGTTAVSAIDLSKNSNLSFLNCGETLLSTLDVSNNPNLWYLNFNTTMVSSVDVSNNVSLLQIHCYNCNLACADLTKNTLIDTFSAGDNSYAIPSNATTFDTKTIAGFDPSKVSNVENADFDSATGVFTNITGDITYTYDCGQGFSATFTLARTGEPIESGGLAIDSTNFPDEVFRNYVSSNFDTDSDGYLSDEEIAAVTEIDVSGTAPADGGVTSLKGVEHFTKLEKLYCDYNSGLTELDVSKNTALTDLDCGDTGTTSLAVSNNTALTVLECDDTEITSLDVSKNTALTYLDCSNTKIASLDVSKNTALTELYCQNTGITSLDVSNNTNLLVLCCYETAITGLDLSNNSSLKTLACEYCYSLSELNVSSNINLENLFCVGTIIESLDVSKNTVLTHLECSTTGITSLDVSNNTALSILYCDYVKIPYLDLTNNTSLTIFSAEGNAYAIPSNATVFDTKTIAGFDPSKVSNVANADFDSATGVFTNITGDITYTYDCGQGFSATFTLARTGEAIESEGLAIDSTNFPDEVFRTYVSSNFDTDSDGYLNTAEIEAVKEINVRGTVTADGGVISLKGVEHFTKLEKLYCYYNSGLTELDVSKNTALTHLYCSDTGITSLDVSKNTALKSLYCGKTGITSLDVRKNTALKILECNDTEITSLDVSKNTALTELDCYNTGITNLDVSKNTALTDLHCGYTEITSLDVSKNTALTHLYCGDTEITSLDLSSNTALGILHCYSTGITSLDVSKNTALTHLYCSDTGITSLDLSSNTALTTLDCGDTGITSLDVSKNTALTYLYCSYTGITSLDVSKNTALEELRCSNTRISSLDVSKNTALRWLSCSYMYQDITNLDISNNINLEYLDCSGCALPLINLTNNTKLYSFSADNNKYPIPSNATTFDAKTIVGFDPSKVSNVANADFDAATGIFTNITGDITYTYDCGQGFSATFTLARTGEAIESENVAIDSTNFPDEVFRTYVSTNFDTDSDGYLSDEEIAAVTEIDVRGTVTADGGVTSLKGVEHFTKLEKLYCNYNSELTELDVSKNVMLDELSCFSTKISALDVTNNIALSTLCCALTGITELDISKNAALTHLDCSESAISELNLSNNPDLVELYCYETNITELDLSQNKALVYLDCYGSGVTTLDLSQNTALTGLYCYETNITELDLSNNPLLEEVAFDHNTLEKLTIRNNTAMGEIGIAESNLTELILSDNTGLNNIGIESNAKLKKISISNNSNLEVVEFCENAELSELVITDNVKLQNVLCERNAALSKLDLTGNTALEELICMNAAISELNLSTNIALSTLVCSNCVNLTSLDVSKCVALTYLDCSYTGLTKLDVSKNTLLKELNCSYTYIPFLNLENNTVLNNVNTDESGYVIPDGATTFNLSLIEGFDVSKVEEWDNCTYDSATNTVTTPDATEWAAYVYDCGGDFTLGFVLKRAN